MKESEKDSKTKAASKTGKILEETKAADKVAGVAAPKMIKTADAEKTPKAAAKTAVPKVKKAAKKGAARQFFSWPATIALLVGIVVGGGLIVYGSARQIRSTYNEVTLRSEEEVKADIAAAYEQVESLRAKRNAIEDTESAEYQQAANELIQADAKRSEYEAELYQVTSAGSKETPRKEADFDGAPLVVIGAAIALLGMGYSYSLVRASRRKRG